MPSSLCVSCNPTQAKFDAELSTSYNQSNQAVVLEYGLGTCSGSLAYETVSTGLNTTISATQQGFVLVETEDSALQVEGINGMLGLAFSALSNGVTTYVQNLKSQGQISSALFSIYLSNDNYTDIPDLKSNIIFGGSDVASYAHKNSGSVKYIDVIAAYWEVKLKKVKFDGDNIDTTADYAVLDTGTSLIVAPPDDYSYIVKQLEQDYKVHIVDGNLAFSCSDTSDMPDMELTLGSYDFKLKSSTIFLYEDGLCYFLVESADVYFWVLGDVFLRNYYAIYDMDNMRVGLVGSITGDSDDSDSSDLPAWAMAVIVVCVVLTVAVAAAAAAIYYFKRRRRQKVAKPEALLINEVTLDE